MNQTLRTCLLFAALSILFVMIGDLAAGPRGAVFALIVSLISQGLLYAFSDQWVLSLYRAQPVERREAPELFEILETLCGRMNLPVPRLYAVMSASPNAFATGRDPQHAAVVVTKGLVDLLNREELEGVLAHELTHIQNRDILIATSAAMMASAISSLVSLMRWMFYFGQGSQSSKGHRDNAVVMLAASLVVPLAALLIRLAISRSREWAADEGGAKVSGNPLYLAGALRKIDTASQQFSLHGAEPATSHLFIVHPVKNGGFASLFRTHPPVEERILRLEALAGGQKC